MDGHDASGERVLVVDDEPHICRIIADVLREEHCHPTLCALPEEALDLFAPGSFGLAFVDINLPGMSGLDLASRLKECDSACDLVVITGFGTIADAVRAIKIGACDFLRKPFDLDDIQMCLQRSRERRALRAKVRLAEERYFQLVQSLPLVIFVLRPDFSLEFINRACSSVLGYAEADALDAPDWLLTHIHVKDREALQTALQTAFEAGGGAFSLECRMHHAKGHLIHTLIASIPSTPDGSGPGPIERLEGSIVDITDRVFWEKALVHQEKIKTLGAVAAEVAHEIRNPLVSIGGFAQRLRKKFPDLPEADIILRESFRLEKLLTRIKGYLKPVDVDLQDCGVHQMLAECVELLAPELERKRLACRLTLTSGPGQARADPEMLRQIFINLIRNAIEAMEGGETLAITSHESDRSLYLDFGNPVPAGRAPIDPAEVFLPFAEGGRSIGLPLSHRLLKSMGGLLSYTQDESRIVFTVSLAKRPAPPAEAAPAEDDAG